MYKCPLGGVVHHSLEMIEKHKAVAKAVGWGISYGCDNVRIGETWDEWEWRGPLGIKGGPTRCPLTNSADAFWLQNLLKIDVTYYDNYERVVAQHNSIRIASRVQPSQGIEQACRLAIFNVAAEIGGYKNEMEG